MNTRLILVCALIAPALCGCTTDPARTTGSLANKTYQQEIGKTLPLLLPLADCEVR
jgi:hypothetical protein